MNGLKNWDYKKIAKFLSYFGFRFSHSINGSHVVWKNNKDKTVELYYYNKKKIYTPRGVYKILKKAGIPQWIAKTWTQYTKTEKEQLGQTLSATV